MSLQSTLKRIWYPDGHRQERPWPTLLLSPPALVYRGLIGFRSLLYDRRILPIHHLPCPVISIGNITVGGTGKTPTVITIAKLLAASGWRPAVLSRGYGGHAKSPVNIVSDGEKLLLPPAEAGDEPVLMARKLPGIPVLAGPERHLTGQAAIDRFGTNVLILDDAFQHRQLHRDFDIVLLDGRYPLGNGSILPAGPLREPADALRRADCLLFTGETTRTEDPWCTWKAWIPDKIPYYTGEHRPQKLIHAASENAYSLDRLREKRICAFAGIARPEAFRRSIETLGGNLTSFLAFPDHHGYTEKDIYAIGETAKKDQADFIVTTEKDGVKLDRYPDLKEQIYLLQISMAISGGEVDFTTRILAKLRS